MKESMFFRSRMHLLLTEDLLDRVIGKFHYEDQHLILLQKVAKDIYGCIKDQEALEIICDLDDLTEGSPVDIAMSLGNNLDILIGKYSSTNQVMEQLMAENIVSELMLEGYRLALDKVVSLTSMNIASMHFWGDGHEYPLEGMYQIADKLSKVKIRIHSSGNLIPSKSTIFRVILTEAEDKYHINLCGDCQYGRSGQCTYGK